MRRPYLVYLLAVVTPSALTIGVGASMSGAVWAGVQMHSEAWAARMALTALEQDLGATVGQLTADAVPTAVTDSAEIMTSRALAGDTASGLALGADGMEVRVALPPSAQDPAGTIRSASSPLPSAAIQAGRTAGYATALYLGGQRYMATVPPPGPESLSAATVDALWSGSEGVPVESGGSVGTLVALEGGAESGAPTFAVLIVAPNPVENPLPLPLLLVMVLLLLFAALAGWIQLSGNAGKATMSSVVLVSLVPAVTAWGFLVQGNRLFHTALEEADRRDLTRALAVASIRGVAWDPAAIFTLSGFHAYRVADGQVQAASLEGGSEAVAALPGPPPSFTSSGRVRTSQGDAAYVALRLPQGGFAVVTSPGPSALEHEYAEEARRLGLALGGWLLLLLGVSVVRRRRSVSA